MQVLDGQGGTPYSTAYTVNGSATFDIDYRTGSVRGTVVDAESSEPLANATIQIRADSQNASFLPSREPRPTPPARSCSSPFRPDPTS